MYKCIYNTMSRFYITFDVDAAEYEEADFFQTRSSQTSLFADSTKKTTFSPIGP